jgi:hypothetical protein
VYVPVKGQKGEKGGILHLITEDVAVTLAPGKVKRHRLALATKPDDTLFLCIVPSENLDNAYNATALKACYQAKTMFLEVISLKAQGTEDYDITPAADPECGGGVAPPKWTIQTLWEIIEQTFKGHIIENTNDPAYRRLIGAPQQLT